MRLWLLVSCQRCSVVFCSRGHGGGAGVAHPMCLVLGGHKFCRSCKQVHAQNIASLRLQCIALILPNTWCPLLDGPRCYVYFFCFFFFLCYLASFTREIGIAFSCSKYIVFGGYIVWCVASGPDSRLAEERAELLEERVSSGRVSFIGASPFLV